MSKLSTFMLLVFACLVVVPATVSDAFVPQPSVANALVSNQLRQSGFLTAKRSNDRMSYLFASTAPSQSGKELIVIDSWEVLPDGRIKGIVADSGDSVLTSPLKKKNGLKEKTIVQTVSGSRYKLGTPAFVLGAGNNISAERLGVPRATLGGINSNANNVRATQPLKYSPTASRNGFMEKILANKGRATMPLQSEFSGSPSLNSNDRVEKKNDLFAVSSIYSMECLLHMPDQSILYTC